MHLKHESAIIMPFLNAKVHYLVHRLCDSERKLATTSKVHPTGKLALIEEAND